MTAKSLILLAALVLVVGTLKAQDDTLRVKSFAGVTVGDKVANAMQTCVPGVPCYLVIDPTLAAYPAGTMPALCASCTLFDYRTGAPFSQVVSGGSWNMDNFTTYVSSVVGGLNTKTEYGNIHHCYYPNSDCPSATPGHPVAVYATEAFTGGVNVPANATHGGGGFQSDVYGAYIVNNSPTSAALSFYGQTRANAIGSRNWAANFVVRSTPGLGGGVGMYGIEIDMNPFHPADSGYGIAMDLTGGITGTFNGAAFFGYSDTPGLVWSTIYDAKDNSANHYGKVPAICTWTGKAWTTANCPSSDLQFRWVDGTGIVQAHVLYVDASGNLIYTPHGVVSPNFSLNGTGLGIGVNPLYTFSVVKSITGDTLGFMHNTSATGSVLKLQPGCDSSTCFALAVLNAAGTTQQASIRGDGSANFAGPVTVGKLQTSSNGTIQGIPAIAGVVKLSAGAATVSTASACSPSSTCIYKLTRCAVNGSTAIGSLAVGTVTAGTSFVIDSLTATGATASGDTSQVCWQIN